jgi:alpha-glucosidase
MQTSETIHPERHGTLVEAGARPIGRVLEVEGRDGDYRIRCEGGMVGVRFLSPGVFRFRIYRGPDLDWTSTPAVVSQLEGIYQSRLTRTGDAWKIATDQLTLTVPAAAFSLAATTSDGDDVYRLNQVVFHRDGRMVLFHHSSVDHHFYGLGEKPGFLDKQGDAYTMWNSDVYAPHNPETDALYVSVPFLIHTNGRRTYGLFLDNPGKTAFDMRSAREAYTVAAYTGDADVYVLPGESVKDILYQFTAITGRIHLPPAWSLGYHQSRYSYMSSDEVEQLAATFREKQIPCDAIHLDIHYMDGYRVFTFHPVRFPDPAGMTKNLSEQGFHVVPIVDPGVKRDPNYGTYRRGISEDVFCRRMEGDLFFGDVWPGTSAFPDFTEDRVVEWWGQEHKAYTEMGIQGIWNDMNEPAVFNDIKTMEPDVMHRNNGKPMTHERLHNLYGLLMTRATYEGMRKLLGGERPFVLTRAGYAGVGRYGAVWTGDNRSFWEHMEMAVPMVLNMGLSGIPFAGPDIGGFAHHASPELLARWTQMGALFPFCRNHSALDTIRQEPWAFGPEVEAICRRYLELRYQWIPYIYSLFYEASQSGVPVMRPLLLEYPDDETTWTLSDQFLLGRDILVAPVFRPGVQKRLVYLPEGTWYDYWTGDAFAGAQHIVAPAPLDTMPIYIRQGAIVPSHPVQQHIDFATVDQLTLTMYGFTEAENTFVLYEDDGHSLPHESGQYNLFEVRTVRRGASSAIIAYQTKHAGYATSYRTRRFVVKHLENPERCTVLDLERIDADAMRRGATGWRYDAERKESIIQVDVSSRSGEIRLAWT